jgi:hypothetical protein
MHCVSRPKREDFARFLHDYRSFQTHCVSRLVPGYFCQRVALKRRAACPLNTHALAKPALAVVVRVLRVPCRARAPMTLASALIATARALSRPSTRVRLEPLAANPARPLARHHCLLSGGSVAQRAQTATAESCTAGGSFFESNAGSFFESGEALST